jgi:hypothetical protein
MPGVLTGAILAMARGAGEVAPLMLVGAVNLAPALPVSTDAPFLHGDRTFMHLGFHIYNLGFQSPDAEAARAAGVDDDAAAGGDRAGAEPVRDADPGAATVPGRGRVMAAETTGAPAADGSRAR